MSPIRRPLPELSTMDAPFLEVLLAFLRDVLHVPTPERLIAHSWKWVIDMPFSPLMRTIIPTKYTVTIVLETPLPSIGNRLYFALEYQDDSYAITEMGFAPGWKKIAPTEEE